MRNDAFISYSHQGEQATAAALQRELQRLGKRWWQRRALRIFRDETNLAAAPHLWGAIAAALAASDWLIVMASPRAAASPWVERELAAWRTRGEDPPRVLVVLCEGTLAWDADRGDFDWERTDALPRAATGLFRDEPLWVDLRGAARRDANVLRRAAARLAAPIHGQPVEDLLSDDLLAQRRALTLAWSVAVLLLALAVAAVAEGVRASRSADEARRQLRTATARRVALQASVAERVDQRIDRALLLALESARIEPSHEADRVLLDTLGGAADAEVVLHGGKTPHGVAFSDDGTRVSAADAADVLTWTLAAPRAPPVNTGFPVRDGSIHLTSDRREVVVSIDGDGDQVDRVSRRAVRLDGHGAMRIWNLATGAPVRRITGAGEGITELAIAPGGTVVAAGYEDGAVRVWSVETGAPLSAPLRGHGPGDRSRAITALALAPGGRLLASAAHDGQVLLWNLGTRRPAPKAVARPGAPTYRLVFNWNGTLLAAAYSNVVEVWDVATTRTVWTLGAHSEQVHDVAFSGDGTRLASASWDGTVVVWRLDDRPSFARRLSGHAASVVAATFTVSGTRGRTLDYEGTLIEWDLSETPATSRPLHLPSGAGGNAVFAGDGRWLVTAEDEGLELVRWDLERAPVERVLLASLPSPAEHIAASAAGRCVAVATEANDVLLLDVTPAPGAQALLSTRAPRSADVVAVSPACDVVVAGSRGGGLSLWDVSTRRRRDIAGAHGGEVFGVALDGRGRLASAGQGTIQLWRTDDLERIGPAVQAHASSGAGAVVLVFDPAGEWLVSSAADARVHLWHVDAMADGPLTLPDVQANAFAVAFSPDGRRLLLGDNAMEASVRDVDRGLWADRACALANRDLTDAEWRTYLAPAPHRATCGGR